MSNQSYKIRVSNEAEALEVVQLFEQLGYKCVSSLKTFKDTKSIQAWSDGEITKSDFHEGIPDDFQEISLPQLRDMVAQKQPEQDLISGADALRALADGKCVQWMTGDEFNDVTDEWQIREFNHPSFKFRLKPSTITVTLTIPAPFEPKLGEEYWYLDSHSSRGYNFATFEEDVFDKGLVQFGVWRTEEEVKQVVAALRQIKGASV